MAKCLSARGHPRQGDPEAGPSVQKILIMFSGNILLVLSFLYSLKVGQGAAGEGFLGKPQSATRAGQRLQRPIPNSGKKQCYDRNTRLSRAPPARCRLPPPTALPRPSFSARRLTPPAAPATAPCCATRISGLRTGLITGVVALIVVIIFIVQNAHAVNISFLGAHLHLSLAVALLLAVIAGALAMAAAGAPRITQLRRIMRRNRRNPDTRLKQPRRSRRHRPHASRKAPTASQPRRRPSNTGYRLPPTSRTSRTPLIEESVHEYHRLDCSPASPPAWSPTC